MSSYGPYGSRTVIQCNCGQVFTTMTDLFDHMRRADPDALGKHHNMTHQVARTQREHEREQAEVDALQRARRR